MIRAGLAALVLAGPVQAECRQALALGLDISGSVDAREYRLQLDGVAEALTSPEVRAALLGMPGLEVEIAVYEWSGPGDLRVTVPFTTVTDAAVLKGIAGTLRGAVRPMGEPTTALGTAVETGARMLEGRDCWQRTLDVSGDGKSNAGPRPREVRKGLSPALTVNALVIATDAEAAELTAYFRAEVLHGPDAFIETALGFEDYARAMERKLVRELRAVVVGKTDQ